ncbi:MAG: 50S ribosomal protein L18e [Candidatus Aenigmarchaeota archaeon]|nr:50S ribosomal protein L18e [Candidatus Aenigmarchaeota archaeon]
MPKPTGPTNPLLQETIRELKQEGFKGDKFLLALGKELNRPENQKPELSVSRLERIAEEGETVAVPGKVLGPGSISKKLTVYASGFSASARKAIEKAGGKALGIEEVKKSKAKIRILK